MLQSLIQGGVDGIYWFSDAYQCTDIIDPSTQEVNDGDVYFAFQGEGCSCMSEECQCVLPLQVTFHVVLSVNENEESLFKLYPSPVKNLLTIDFDKEISDFTVRITNINGKLVYKERVHSPETDFKIDVSKWGSGVYILGLWADGKHQTNKIIVE